MDTPVHKVLEDYDLLNVKELKKKTWKPWYYSPIHLIP